MLVTHTTLARRGTGDWKECFRDGGERPSVAHHVAVEWKDRGVSFHVYCDTQDLESDLVRITSLGVAEAALPPLEDSVSQNAFSSAEGP